MPAMHSVTKIMEVEYIMDEVKLVEIMEETNLVVVISNHCRVGKQRAAIIGNQILELIKSFFT